ncbi:hypothetical protein EJD97_021901 [Solanum chilense]|uniref:Gag-pol polyprotein n=1 Tax=Solanum chilense TaxID=4083 RepID=A0A6N2C3V4_SOLCI|nr:hypothetical protein EJD97_021901 [Solanum chilense]
MNIRRNNVRRANEENVNETVPPQDPQNPQVSIEEGTIRAVIYSLSQVLATQVSRDTRVQVNPSASTTSSRIRDFTRMNPHTLFCSKEQEDPHEFFDEVFKVLGTMGVSSQ